MVFFVGLLIGLLVAGGFFLFKLDDYFKELNFYKHFAETFSSEKKTEDTQQMKSVSDEEKKFSKNEKKRQAEVVDNEQQKIIKKDSLKNQDVDSLSYEIGTMTNDDIVVKKDELITSKTVELVIIDIAAKNNSKDSLLHKVSGIPEDKNNKPFLNIEFWQSPLNYKGYKMSKYKLVIYGINPSDNFKLYKVDEMVYLKSNSVIYKLDYSSDFRPYEKTTDESIIAKLK
jgi:hypothetical protein